VFSRLGSAGYVKWADDMGFLSAHNFQQHHYQGAARLDSKHLQPYRRRSSGCTRCPIQCKALVRFTDGKYAGYEGVRPEFEPMLNLGAKCGLDDLPTLVYLDNLCTRLGMDSLSTGGVIAFAMDLFDRGMLTKKDTGGLPLRWGDGIVMETLIRQICDLSGFGKILAQGVRGAAQSIGGGAQAFAPHVKGLELTAYHPNHLLGAALGYAVSSRGGDFNNTYSSFEHRWTADRAAKELGVAEAVDPTSHKGKGSLIARSVLVNLIVDSLGLCKIPTLSLIGTFDLEAEAALTAALTGRPFTAASLFLIAERIAALERLFNLRQGITHEDDWLPAMFLNDPSQPLNAINFKQMVADFYHVMGWDDHGTPLANNLARLGISSV
jgi:aldehyde:ferredoxin oxidoreductase